MLDLLIIRHEADSTPGTVLKWAREKELNFHVWEISQTPHPPLPAKDVKALVICGGSMDTWEEEKHPWLKIEKNFIQECLKLKKPIYGICLGSQLLAEALGGRVYKMPEWEIGFQPVLLQETNEELQVFHWHRFTFDLPPGARLWATHRFCPTQAFSYGENVVATQFHPEAEESWIRQCADWVTEETYHGRVQSKEEMLASLHLQPILQTWFFNQLDRWYKTAP